MDILKRALAPITDAAWTQLDQQARTQLQPLLSARKCIRVEGPYGLEYAAVPLGRLTVPESPEQGVAFGLNQVQPLLEARAFFEMAIWELDNVARGAQDVDFAPLDDACRRIAAFEEQAIYYGFEGGSIAGLKNACRHTLKFTREAESLIDSVYNGIQRLAERSVIGPYALVIGLENWSHMAGTMRAYPLQPYLEAVLGGPVIHSPLLTDAFLVSTRGGDQRLVLGQDLAVGFHSADGVKMKLFLTESFTFQVIVPEAAVYLQRIAAK